VDLPKVADKPIYKWKLFIVRHEKNFSYRQLSCDFQAVTDEDP
jgi:hypothetical protein